MTKPKAIVTQNNKDSKYFLQQCKRIDPSEPFLIRKINQMVAYYITRMESKDRDLFFDYLESKFFDGHHMKEVWDAPLCELWEWDWKAFGRNRLSFNILFSRAVADGLDVPISSKSRKTPKTFFFQNLIKIAHPFKPETVAELFAIEEVTCCFNFGILVDAIRKTGDKKLSEASFSDLCDIIDADTKTTDRTKKDQKKMLKAHIKKSIEKGWVTESFRMFDNPMLKALRKHKKLGDIPIKERSLEWYFFEVYRDMWVSLEKAGAKNEDRNQVSPRYNVLPKIMPSEMTLQHYKKIDGRNGKMRELMIEDGALSVDFFQKEEEEYDASSQIWVIDGSTLNFARISDESVRRAVMALCKEVQKTHRPETLASHITAGQYLSDFIAESNFTSLLDLTKKHKQKFYSYVDELHDNGQYTKAEKIIKLVRKLYKTLDTAKKRKGLIAPDLYFHKGEYSLPKKPKNYDYPILSDIDMQRILDHLKDIRKMKTSKRIARTATVLQLMLARRPSETIGLDLDCIVRLGDSGDWLLKFWSEKQNAKKKVSASVLCGNRKDPFAKAMHRLVPEIIREITELTETIRNRAPNKIKNKVFIRHGQNTMTDPIIVEKLGRTGAEWTAIKKELGITTKVTLHNARHTMATRLIRTGSNYIQAAEALGDAAITVKRNYSATVSKLETMSLPKGHLINNIENDIKEIAAKKYSSPKPLSIDEASRRDDLNDVCGGKCNAGQDKMYACETFIMTKGGSGCKGCPSFFPAPQNLPFWRMELRSDYANMQKSRGTPLYPRYKLNYKRTENLVKTLKELANG